MAVYLIGKENKPHKAHYVSVLTEPSTYDADITPENMQRGMTAYAQGKKLVGTGKAFEFASYGRRKVDLIIDENGNDKYGFVIEGGSKSNIIFFSATSDGDFIYQDEFILGELEEGTAFKVGENATTKGNIVAFSFEGLLLVYFSNTPNLNTQITYFAGKDNKI